MKVSYSITPNGTIYLWDDDTNKIIYVADSLAELRSIAKVINEILTQTTTRAEKILDAIDTICLDCPSCDESTCSTCLVRTIADYYNKNRP